MIFIPITSLSECICVVTVPCAPLCLHRVCRVWKQLNSYLHTSCHLGSAWPSRSSTLWIKRLGWIFFSILRTHIYSQDTRCFVWSVFFHCVAMFLSENKRPVEISVSHLGITYCNKTCWLNVQITQLQKHLCKMMLGGSKWATVFLNDFIHNAKSVHGAHSERKVIKEQQLKLSVISVARYCLKDCQTSQAVIGVPAVHI